MDYHINLGTAGWGVWHSPDAGKSWVRHRKPFPLNSRIQALAVLPGEPHGLMAAGDTGVFATHDGGASWERIGAAGDRRLSVARRRTVLEAARRSGRH
jgi:photosystem II stability/assembly factor-like uncharacterized protein